MMSAALVERSELEPGISQLVLNDPEVRNAMSDEMSEQFLAAVKDLRSDTSLRAVILKGAGQAFSAGGNLDMLLAKTKLAPRENRKRMETFYYNFLSLLDLEIPVIAAINGHAVGAGLCIAMACDIRIAKTGSKLGANFVRLGLHPGMAATYFLPRLVGQAKAAELLYTGRIISAEEAQTIGLVNCVASENDFDKFVIEMAREIATAGPEAVRELKLSLRTSERETLREALKREADCQGRNYAGKEFFEGITAAKEKRAAKFPS